MTARSRPRLGIALAFGIGLLVAGLFAAGAFGRVAGPTETDRGPGSPEAVHPLAAPAESTSARTDSASAIAAPDALPDPAAGLHPAIHVGEKLTFTVRYGMIKAGTAVMEVAGPMRVYGRPAYQVVSTAASNSMFNGIYRVRDRVLSMMDAETLESLYFEKHLREGRYRADSRVRFDRERRVAVYHDDREFAIEPGTFDVLAAFYRVRTLPLRLGETFYLTSHENRKNYPIKVVVTGRERLDTPAGTFNCLVLEPTLRSGAFFKNEGRLTIWLTDDERRMPVLMRSKLPIGAISVELVEAQRPEVEGPPPAAKAAGETG